jgi:DNA-binding NtrC family response regulator
MVAEDPRSVEVLGLMRKVAPSDAPVLITGEAGTGKEVVARCIHDHSPRASHAFVAVNCAGLSPALMESELFGHEKGAYSGSASQHVGRFERAHKGTVFLNEVGELDAHMQAKLIRLLEEKTFERVGGIREISTDVRIIAGTRRDLAVQVEGKRFRADLYQRLIVCAIAIPPLRERPGDIIPMARYFLNRSARAMNKPSLRLASEAEDVLLHYSWPGNVSELQNVVERVAILCEREVGASDLPLALNGGVRPVLFKDIERQAILGALRDNGGNRTRTARQLGISLRTLQCRLKEYGVTHN